MARGRFISATLGGSRKFARLANDRHRMIYQLLIPSADAYGRIDADPITLGGRVLTRLGIAPDEISAALADMHEVGLIHLYQVGEDQYAEIVNFHEHNDIDLSREAQAEIPDARGVMPPKKPPRGTSRADADPRVWSGDYLAANAHPSTEPDSASQDTDTTPPLLSGAAPDTGNQAPHTANQRQSKPSAIRLEVEGEVEVEEELNPPTPQNAEPLAPPDVEATPRRASGKKPPSKARPKFDPSTIPLPDFVSRDVWNDWVAHRHKLRKPLTERAVELTLADLAKTPLDADEMLRTSIKRGWTGVFPLDRNRPRPASDVTGTALDQYTERGL